MTDVPQGSSMFSLEAHCNHGIPEGDSCPTAAGSSLLCKLPVQLLYQVTRLLHIRDQRNVFLSCSTLYKCWNVQLQETDPKLHFLLWCFALLQQSCCDARLMHSTDGGTSIKAFFSSNLTLASICASSGQGLASGSVDVDIKPVLANYFSASGRWSQQNANQLMHRLTSSPAVTDASITLASHSTKNWHALKDLAESWFAILSNHKGYLIFCMPRSMLPEGGCDASIHDELRITHCDSRWTVDGVPCKRSPVQLDFDQMTKEVIKVVAQIYDKTATWTDGLLIVPCVAHIEGGHIAQDDPAQDVFAYNGNVDDSAVANSLLARYMKGHVNSATGEFQFDQIGQSLEGQNGRGGYLLEHGQLVTHRKYTIVD